MNNGFNFKKKYGQNFLRDKNLLEAIAMDAGITSTDTVLEIGAGDGALTEVLARKAGRVVAIEIDKELEPVLNAKLAHKNVTLVFADALKLKPDALHSLVGEDYCVVANLPYYITTPLIFMLLEAPHPPKSLTLMVQKEVALRIVASPNTPDYGALSANCQYRADCKITRSVSRKLFYPQPNVDSAIVCLSLKNQKTCPYFEQVVRSAFHMRRKTLSNNLMSSFNLSRKKTHKLLSELGKEENIRGETLSVEEFARLATLVEKELSLQNNPT